MRTFARKPKTTKPTTSAKASAVSRAHVGQGHDPNSILNIQSTLGNQVLMRLLRSNTEERNAPLTGTTSHQFGHDFSRIRVTPPIAGAIQTKPAIDEPGDEYEQEADRVAEQVMRMPEPQMQLACARGGESLKWQTENGEQGRQHLQTKHVESGALGLTEAPPSVLDVLRSPGRPLTPATRAFMEPRFGHDFSRIRVHSDAASEQSARDMNARAYTVGQNIAFGCGQFAPRSHEGRRLLAHELVHTVQQDRGLLIQRKVDPARSSFPWIGRIDHTWSASLRRTPAKDPGAPHGNTLADLPKGTEVKVVGQAGGWMRVQVSLAGETLTGYVSTELITYVSESAFEVPDIVIPMEFPSVAEAFVELKRAERRKAKEGSAFKPTDEEQSRIDRAIIVLNGTKKYTVNETTFEVDFATQAGKAKTTITTIEDFILFVEQVEKQYPSASPKEVASEVRQLWFSDANWEILSASSGISQGGKVVDIETEPDPIASRFDMKQVAPASGSLQLDTRMGKVDIGHVMSGIDVRLSGFSPSVIASLHGKKIDLNDLQERTLKYRILKEASGGNTLDFATWAGDLGQAYAEYLVARYVKGNASASLKTVAAAKAPSDELLGDVHGYIAVDVYKKVPASVSPTGTESKVSNMLRDMYLVGKSAARETNQMYFEQVSGKSSSELKPFITDRALRFARPWFAKKAVEERGFWGSEGWTKEGILENTLKEFDKKHSENEKNAAEDNKLKVLVDSLLQLLSAPVK